MVGESSAPAATPGLLEQLRRSGVQHLYVYFSSPLFLFWQGHATNCSRVRHWGGGWWGRRELEGLRQRATAGRKHPKEFSCWLLFIVFACSPSPAPAPAQPDPAKQPEKGVERTHKEQGGSRPGVVVGARAGAGAGIGR